MARLGLIHIDEIERSNIRSVVHDARHAWMNDGEDREPRELLRRAFRIIRDRVFKERGSLDAAIGDLQVEIARHEDM